MIIECAPMQGVTDYIFRRVQSGHFTPADKYYTPFVATTQNHVFTPKMLKELSPEINAGISVVPQLIGHDAEDFLWAARELKALGYREVNFNLGCPSGTVVGKKKGAGLLSEKDMLRAMLDEIFEKSPIGISVKTRIGRQSPEEFAAILELYNDYPMTELIIHPRLQKQQYEGTPHMNAWEIAVQSSKNLLCYNGDIFDRTCAEAFAAKYPQIGRIMLGRGLAANPKLVGEMRGEAPVTKEELRAYHDDTFAACREKMPQDKPLLLHLKEFWYYFSRCFADSDKALKQLRKAQTASDYLSAVDTLFAHCSVKDVAGFEPYGV